jgi:putative ATP-dependent endonuclease of the OLD family
LFETIDQGEDDKLSIFLTTHSPHIASVAPLRSILLLKDTDEGTVGRSTAALDLKEDDISDLTRYLDVTRAEMLFARGVILVEGDTERFLVPVFAATLGVSLDHLGITVCSVAGTNFQPYAKFLTSLGIPFSVITDWDLVDKKPALGHRRALKLVETIYGITSGEDPAPVVAKLKAFDDMAKFSDACDEYGVFTGLDTLELDLFEGDYIEPILETLNEGPFGKTRKALISGWEDDPDTMDPAAYMAMIEAIGKGRFAQRLAPRIEGLDPPKYIERAIKFVAKRV